MTLIGLFPTRENVVVFSRLLIELFRGELDGFRDNFGGRGLPATIGRCGKLGGCDLGQGAPFCHFLLSWADPIVEDD